MPDDPSGPHGPAHDHPQLAPDYYGGQAVVEGVMMRGADTWAVAVRQPDRSIWVEAHEVSDLPRRRTWLQWPLVRGVYTLGDSLAIGTKALGIAAQRAYGTPAGDTEDELGSPVMAASLLLALAMFVGVFIVVPSAATKLGDVLLPGDLGDGVAFHVVESVVRIGVFVAYLFAISLLADIRRVFEYHGAEHMTIHAWEDERPLSPEVVAGYPTEHVRCGTNFLVLVMLLALVVYSLAGAVVPPPAGGAWVALGYHVVLRIVLLPVVAGLAYEGLRLGARRGDNPLVRALVAPGIWLQRITTRPPDHDQVEVAIRAFQAVVPSARLGERVPALPSAIAGPAAGDRVGDDAPGG